MTDLQRCEIRPGRLVEWTLHPASGGAARALLERAEKDGIDLGDSQLRRATLEDVFLKLTGRRIRD